MTRSAAQYIRRVREEAGAHAPSSRTETRARCSENPNTALRALSSKEKQLRAAARGAPLLLPRAPAGPGTGMEEAPGGPVCRLPGGCGA